MLWEINQSFYISSVFFEIKANVLFCYLDRYLDKQTLNKWGTSGLSQRILRSFAEIPWFIIISHTSLINLINRIYDNAFSCVVKIMCLLSSQTTG